MLYHYNIDDIIPLLAIGAISIIVIYHTILYYFSRLKLVGRYTIYLWFALLYLLLAVSTVPTKTFITPSLNYVISSGVFWVSFLCYLNFLVVVLEIPKDKEPKIYKWTKKIYLFTPFFFPLRFPYFFFPIEYVEPVKKIGLVMDLGLFYILGYFAYLLLTSKNRGAKNYVVIGNLSIIFFNAFTSITYYTQGYILGLSHVSFIALGYFGDIIFFSLAVGLQMRINIKEKYHALNEVSKKEFALEMEKKKASDILITQDFEIEKEKNKAIIEQRVAIGRKLHDDLSGSLVALRYYIADKIKKLPPGNNQNVLHEIDDEIMAIYSETRDYSHFLSNHSTEPKSNYYHIGEYLEAMKSRFENLNFFTIETVYSQDELTRYLNPEISEQIYYFLKECLANIIKHAKASQLRINISFSENHVKVEIVDNGKGFEINSFNDGMGLKNLKFGIQQINGKIDVKSSYLGTSITAIVPIYNFNEFHLVK